MPCSYALIRPTLHTIRARSYDECYNYYKHDTPPTLCSHYSLHYSPITDIASRNTTCMHQARIPKIWACQVFWLKSYGTPKSMPLMSGHGTTGATTPLPACLQGRWSKHLPSPVGTRVRNPETPFYHQTRTTRTWCIFARKCPKLHTKVQFYLYVLRIVLCA